MRKKKGLAWMRALGLAALTGMAFLNAVAEPAAPKAKPAGQATNAPAAPKLNPQPTAPKPRPQPAAPEDEIEYVPPYIALALKAGTLGPGAELTVGLIPEALNLRLGGNFLPLQFSGKIKDVDYSVDLKWASVPLMLDWHPFFNNFRITGAVLYNRNRANLDAKLNDVQKIGDHDYTPEEIGTLSGNVDFNAFAPYLGIGFGNAVGGPKTSWNFSFDVGVMFQGVPSISLSADGTKSGDPTFQSDLGKEEDNVQSEARKFQFYPVISAGVSYQF